MDNTVVIMLTSPKTKPSPILMAEMSKNSSVRIIIAENHKSLSRSLKKLFETDLVIRLMYADPNITTFEQLSKKLLTIHRQDTRL